MRPVVATIDLAAIIHNYQLAKRCAPERQAFAVVKANAYGHGARRVVEALAKADGFAVACLEEAIEVREVNQTARIILLQGAFEAAEYLEASRHTLDVVVQGKEQLALLLNQTLAKPINVWLKFDTGMHRLGFNEIDMREAFAVLKTSANVREINLISHFACADIRGHELTEDQVERYLSVLDLPFTHRTLANSAAILTIPAAHMDWVRPGIMLYGASPFADLSAKELGLKPAMTLTAQITAIREVAAGESVGYGATWIANQPSRIATVSCGYADGYPRHAPSGTPVVINGERAPLAGRVSMDMLGVDMTGLKATVGDRVELWGAQLPIDEIANACGSIGYELLSKVTARVPRQYD